MTVDDENHIRRLVRVNLERAGYIVCEASNGREALEAIMTERPDVILRDMMMPIMDGHELLKNLRGDPDTAKIGVIMLSQKTQDADVFRGWQAGVDCYLFKPFNPMEVLKFVDRIVKHRGLTVPQGRKGD